MNTFTATERQIILTTANESIRTGLVTKHPLVVQTAEYSTLLQQPRACFVTLQINHALRGCIGSLVAYRPLIEDVAHNAYSAAFGDPRFSPLTLDEYHKIDVHISVLSSPEPINFVSEDDLLHKIRPRIDGLILSSGSHRGTFLPSVWEQLPEPRMFLQHLKNKAGLPKNFWADNIKVERYTAEMIES